jgi:hypothetical protein
MRDGDICSGGGFGTLRSARRAAPLLQLLDLPFEGRELVINVAHIHTAAATRHFASSFPLLRALF